MWCEDDGVDYIFGLAGNDALARLVRGAADDLCVRRAEAGVDKLRTFSAFAYAAKTWRRKGHVVARLEATRRGFDNSSPPRAASVRRLPSLHWLCNRPDSNTC